MMSSREPPAEHYNGLTELVSGLPASAYYAPERYALELRQIWYRQWIYVGRSSTVRGPRQFLAFNIGDQPILLVRDDRGVLQGFFNTCRHRGATLCTAGQGTLPSNAIACPYHAWVYNLQGELLRTSSKMQPSGFEPKDFGLYKVSVHEWRGFVFVALTDAPPPFETCFDPPVDRLAAWPLEDLQIGHVLIKTIQCNWKVFWENFNECLHCPGVHRDLSRLVPIYGRGIVREGDDPKWQLTAADPDPRFKGGLRADATSWSSNGQLTGLPFEGLSEQDQRRGSLFVTGLPSLFIVAHTDYLRVVRMRPLGPEQLELHVEYLFSPATLALPGFDMSNIVEFTNQVLSEDAGVCELNQRGLHAAAHAHGVIMPEEYLIRQFHEWIGSEISRV